MCLLRLNAPWCELCRARERISINSTLWKNVVANPQNPNAEIAFIFFQMLSRIISLILAWRETRDIFNWKKPGCREGVFSPGPWAFNAASWLQLPWREWKATHLLCPCTIAATECQWPPHYILEFSQPKYFSRTDTYRARFQVVYTFSLDIHPYG